MHWFWRSAIAVLVGSALGVGWLFLSESFARNVERILGGSDFAAVYLVWMVPSVAVSFLLFGVLTHWFGPAHGDSETRCRKCGYILRGLTEPRCPECGERI